MKPSDLPLLNSLSRPTIHPDGSTAVVAVSRPDLESDASVAQLFSVRLDDGAARRISRGRNDSSPRFSPDGRLLAFVRAVAEHPGQLFVMAANGGEAVQVTDAKLGIGAFRWSPDSARIAFTAAVAEPGRYGTVEGLGASAEPARRITTLKYKSNGFGYTIDRRRHVFLVEVPDPEAEPVYPIAPSASEPDPKPTPAVPAARQLTSGDFDHTAIEFAPNGRRIAVVSTRHASRDSDLVSHIYELDLDLDLSLDADAHALTQLTPDGPNLGVSSILWASQDEIFFVAIDLGATGMDFIGRAGRLYRLDRRASGADVRLLTPGADIDLGETTELTLARAGVLAQNRIRGRIELVQITADGTVTPVIADAEVGGHDAVGDQIVASVATDGSMGELVALRDGHQRVLTNFSAAARSRGHISPTELTVTGRDGYPVHGWTLTPAGDGPHPVLLNIHGGPFSQYGISFFDEAQVYSAAGYAVVMCNPRGAAGYGEDHARAIRGRMGTLDHDDVIDFLDGALAANPSFDAERVGIMGGSYGGYLTAWTIAHTQRFAAAIVERGYLDPESFVGTSDSGSFFSDEYTGADPAHTRTQSAQAVVGQVTTPTLVIHSADDLRCPLGQGEQYYSALKRNGVPTELLVFPGENHELSRTGRPRHRLQRFDAVLEWWNRYLPIVGQS
jgi:dipeptidyl aminopeptidase/acylaminoacyl peptidase